MRIFRYVGIKIMVNMAIKLYIVNSQLSPNLICHVINFPCITDVSYISWMTSCSVIQYIATYICLVMQAFEPYGDTED